MFDLELSKKDGTSVLSRHAVRPEVVIAALQILSQDEILTVSFASNPKE